VRLTDSLDLVVGETEVLLHRHESLEGAMNNFIADAFHDALALDSQAARTQWASLDVVSMTNGFRFDTVVLPADMLPLGGNFRDGRQPGEVTQRDLWSYFPVAAGMVAADYNGVAIEENLNNILANVFSPNPYIQRGGWYLGLSSNMSQKVDVVRLPGSTSGSRILETRVNGKLIDHSKRYVIASCYGHTFALGRSCRIEGGANTLFFQLADADDYDSAISTVEPLITEGLISNKPGQGAVAGRAAPDNYLHPIHTLRRYLDKVGTITAAKYGHDAAPRVKHVNAFVTVDSTGDGFKDDYASDPLPASSSLPGIVQNVEGLGPEFLKRGVLVK
jgi:hypothetical protein